MSLLHAAVDDGNLYAAWQKVRANAGMAGVDGQTIEQFAVNVFGRLQTLAQHIAENQYRPAALRRLGIPKDNGRIRYLAIPGVRWYPLCAWCQERVEWIGQGRRTTDPWLIVI